MATQLGKSTLIFNSLKEVSELVDDMAGELQPAIDALDEKKRERTILTNNLKDTLLDEIPKLQIGDFFDGKVSAFFEQEFEIVDDTSALRQILAYADTYKEITGVDILSALVSIKIGGVKDRVLADPRKFGLIAKTDEDGIVTWESKGMCIDRKKKIRVARNLA